MQAPPMLAGGSHAIEQLPASLGCAHRTPQKAIAKHKRYQAKGWGRKGGGGRESGGLPRHTVQAMAGRCSGALPRRRRAGCKRGGALFVRLLSRSSACSGDRQDERQGQESQPRLFHARTYRCKVRLHGQQMRCSASSAAQAAGWQQQRSQQQQQGVRHAPEQVVCDDKGAAHGCKVERLAELERVGLALGL